MGEPKRSAPCDDPRQCPLHIAKYLPRRNAHRLETLSAKPGIARFVARRPIAAIMRLAVDLDAKPRLQTGEVEHIPALRALLAKLEAVRPLSKLLPQQDLGQAHLLAQPSRPFHRSARRADGSVLRAPLQILPGTGRGTIRRSRMVEGPNPGRRAADPSVSPAASHLPVPGRIWVRHRPAHAPPHPVVRCDHVTLSTFHAPFSRTRSK